jgi:hypothetical protein
VCCVDGAQAWIIDRLVQVRGDTGGVQVAANIPTPPPPPPTATPAPPTATPEPAGPPDPGCGNCTFRKDGGPEFFPDSNNHVKIYVRVWHISRQEPQFQQRVHIERNGQDLSSDKLTGPGFSNTQNNRPYNYDIDFPGDPSGTYTMWVVDGNGNRDSANVTFTVPAGQHEVWVSFGQ